MPDEPESGQTGGLQFCNTPWRAITATIVLLVLVLSTYLLVHRFRTPSELPWKQEPLLINEVVFRAELRPEKWGSNAA